MATLYKQATGVTNHDETGVSKKPYSQAFQQYRFRHL